MKKSTIFGIAAALAVLAGAAGGAVYYVNSLQSRSGFLDRTFINGRNVSGKMPAQVVGLLSEGIDESRITVTEDGNEIFGASLEELGYTLDSEALEASLTRIMDSEKKDLRVVLDGVLNGNSFDAALPFKSDAKVFDAAVSVDALSAPRKKNKNAKILFYEKENECRIRPEVQGTELEDGALRKWLRGEIEAMLAEQAGGPSGYQKETRQETSDEGAYPAETKEAAEEILTEEASEEEAEKETPAKEVSKTEASKKEASKKETSDKEESEKEASTKEAAKDVREEAAKGASGEAAGAEENAESGAGDTSKKDKETVAPKKSSGSGEGRFNLVCEIPESLYTLPDKKASDKEIQEKCKILNKYVKVTVTYDFGSETEKLEFKTFMNWLKVRKGKVQVREDKVKKYVEKLIDKYETRYHERVFMTTWGYPVTFSPGWNEYGYTILEDEEIRQLTQDILSGKSVEREPVYLTYNDWGCPLYFSRNGTDDLNGTYVEVNLSAQHMWYYLYGSLVVESDVVTGDVTKDLGTASGVFPLAFKESPSILRGGEGKERYETKVQYWMPFYEGQGLHDANWRSRFGGTIYRGDGSHGCVNLPTWVAEVLYNNIVPGTAIVLYW